MIFICDFDPFGEGLYRYTFENSCLESPGRRLGEGSRIIFLSTRGKNTEEVPEPLVSFLRFAGADLQESCRISEDNYIRQLQESIRKIKMSRDMEERFMTLEELLRDKQREAKAEGKAEGKAEAVLELLDEKGLISEELSQKILSEKDPELLKRWLKIASAADSVNSFEQEM